MCLAAAFGVFLLVVISAVFWTTFLLLGLLLCRWLLLVMS